MTIRRFRTLVALVMIGLATLTVAVIAAGDRTEPVPLSIQPADGERLVPGSSSIVLRFGRPVDQETVAAFLVIEPPVSGTLQVTGSVARFMPTGGLRSGTSYRITLRAGLQDQSARTLRRDVSATFETRPARLVFSRPEADTPDVLAARNLWVTGLDSGDPAGSPARRLTSDPHGILFAAVAPDGERVVYSSPNPSAPDASGLWIVNLDGTGSQQLTGDLDSAILSVGWSPRGDLIAYERRSIVGLRGELGRPRILAIRPDGGGGGLLYGRNDEAGSQPVWSPDGRRLLIAENGRGGRAVVDLAGQPTYIPGSGTDSGSWSPDGQFVAFADLVQEATGARSAIRTADLAGRIVADLGRTGYSDTAPAWAPDGRTIAVVGRHEDGESAVWLLSPTGGAARRVTLPTAPPDAQLTPPVWSASGDLLAFSRLVPRHPTRGASRAATELAWELWVARGDGLEPRRLPVDGLAEGWAE